MKNELKIYTSYVNYKGGTNNLQICQIVSPSPFGGLVNIIKTFTSKIGKAEKKANQFINQY